ncbi:hypothetical protein Q7P36_005692 [Cladosporium allicinum]
MADQASKDAAAQARIVNHMQKDHHDSIVRYLEHYHSLSPWTASASRLTAMDLTGMDFIAGSSNKHYRIPFDPPLESYREARERVVAMDKTCVAALNRSDITINEFLWPKGLYAFELAVVAATFVGFSQRWWFASGEIVEAVLGSGFARFGLGIQPWLLGGLFVIHGAELAWRLWNGIRDHGECVEGATFPFDDDSGLSNGVVFGRAAIADPDMT